MMNNQNLTTTPLDQHPKLLVTRAMSILKSTFVWHLLCVMGAGIFMVTMIKKKQEFGRQLAVRDGISIQTRETLGSLDLLRLAASQLDLSPGNHMLARCLSGRDTCTATDATRPVSFAMRTNRTTSAQVIIGTDSNPALFDESGLVGTPLATTSPKWSVAAWFWVECPGGSRQCALPTTLYVRHQVAPIGLHSSLAATPSVEELALAPHAHEIIVDLGMDGGSQTRAPGEVVR